MAQNNNMIKNGRCLNIGNCNKANTKEIIEVNIGEDFVCPECNGDLVEQKIKKTPWLIIGGGATALIIAIGAFFFFTQKAKQTIVNEIITIVDEIPIEEIVDTVIENDITENEKPEELVNTNTTTTESIVTKDLQYAVWTGKVKNGKLHDVQGTLKFKVKHIIESRDEKKRMANPGDKVIGTFENGHLTQGKWYKSDGNVESIIL